MKSSETSAKYSWPRREQKEVIHDSGVPEEEDITDVVARDSDAVEADAPGEARLSPSRRASKNESPLADTMMVDEGACERCGKSSTRISTVICKAGTPTVRRR